MKIVFSGFEGKPTVQLLCCSSQNFSVIFCLCSCAKQVFQSLIINPVQLLVSQQTSADYVLHGILSFRWQENVVMKLCPFIRTHDIGFLHHWWCMYFERDVQHLNNKITKSHEKCLELNVLISTDKVEGDGTLLQKEGKLKEERKTILSLFVCLLVFWAQSAARGYIRAVLSRSLHKQRRPGSK